jgi:hypothetical protein
MMGDEAYKPGPDATTWENDYRLLRFWLGRALAVWAAIPVEFRGDIHDPPTLVEKVKALVAALEASREECRQLQVEVDGLYVEQEPT